MKRKLLFGLALLVCGGGNLWAQTDVTSQYFVNPSFEYSAAETASTAQALTNGGTYYGWTLPNLGTQYVNISIGDGSNCNGQAFGIPTASEGSYYYFERRGWNSSSSADATMSTTLSSLPVGHYELTMAYKGLDSWDKDHTSKGSYLKIEAVDDATLASVQTDAFDAVNGNNAGANKFTSDANWKSISLVFDVTTAGDVTLKITHHLVGGVRTDVVIDNLTLSYTDPEAAAHAAALEAAKYTLNGYIKKATALNGVMADATLTSAIETAQSVYDAADDYAEDYDNTVGASSTLSSAITTALSSTTTVSLSNANFNTTPNNTLSGTETVFGGTLSTATSNPDNTKDMSANTGDHGYLYEVTGWTQFSKFNSTAAQGTTSEYGTAMPANGWSTNSTTPPATDMFGGTDGAALHLSAGWGDQARYQQTVNSLPSGRYLLYYEAINLHSNTAIASNYIGVNGTAGDFYGTTNSFVYSDLKTIEQGVWKAQAFEFDVAKEADINFSVGVTTSTSGSGNGAKLWIDNVLVYRLGDVIVTEEDANTIIASVSALDESVYNAADKSALAAAKTTFEGSKTLENYNALSAALVTAQESVATYATLNAAITNVEGWSATSATTAIRSKYTNGEYADETTAADIYEAYQAAEIAALADASATDYTSAIINPSFETGDMTGWSAESRTDTKVWPNSNVTYTTSGVDGSYLFNSWGGTAENNVYQTIKNLPAGTYTLSALLAGFNGEELVLAANETTNSVTVAGDKTTGYTVNVVFTLADAADVVIKASNTKSQDGSDASFIKADNFKLIAGDITTDDYTALIAAIEAADAKTIGFDEGEYAPYNNVAALAALKAAKAVDQSVAMAQTDLDAIVSALTSATWTVNASEVNAFYDGNFAIQDEHTTGPTALTGWNNPNGIRQLIKNTDTYPGLTSATGQAAVFAWGGTTMTYGDAEGYTLPLNAHTIYELSFKTCGWSDGDMGYVNVDIKNASNEGLQTVTTATAKKRITESEPWDEFRILFVTGEAGDYKFGMWTSKHTTFTDLSLVKAASQTLTLPSATKYAAGTYPTVTLARTFYADKWNTLCVPFDFAASSFDAVKVLNSVEEVGKDVSMKFVDAEGTVAAGTPCLVKNGSLTVENVDLDPAATAGKNEATVGNTTVTYQGTYAGTMLTDADSNAWVVSNNDLYHVNSDVTVGAFRAYFTVATTSGEVKSLSFDFGGETAIQGVEADGMSRAAIFNLAGQRVKNAQKGIYIVNGKKVLVK